MMYEIFKQLSEKYNLIIEASINLDIKTKQTVHGYTSIYRINDFEHGVLCYCQNSIKIYDMYNRKLRYFDNSMSNCYIVLDEILKSNIHMLNRFYTNDRNLDNTDN